MQHCQDHIFIEELLSINLPLKETIDLHISDISLLPYYLSLAHWSTTPLVFEMYALRVPFLLNVLHVGTGNVNASDRMHSSCHAIATNDVETN